MLQLSFIWQTEENTSSRHEGGLTQKMQREAPSSILAPLFMFFFSPPLSLPYVNWASQEGLFVFPEVPTTDLGPSFVLFSWAFPVFGLQGDPTSPF